MARKKGAGSIEQVGNNFYLSIRIAGKRKRINLEAKDRADAEVKASNYNKITEARDAEELALLVERARNKRQQAEALKISETMSAFEASPLRPRGETTIEACQYIWKEFEKWVAGQAEKMNEVTPEIAEKFVAYLEDFPGNHGKTLTARTWNRHLTSLKLIYRTLSRQSGGKNPFEHIPRRPTVDNCKKEFTATQLDGIFKAIKDKTIILQNRKEIEILFRIGIYSGMRQCDCVLLEWSDIDFIQETIKCKNLKTGNPVIIPMIPEFLAILKKWRQDHRGSRYVLPQTARRFGTSPTALNNDLTRIIDYGISSLAERKGGKRPKRKSAYGFHSLRHTFVSNCAAAGVSLAVVQSIVGHGSPAMTRHYTHIGTNTAREELRRISSGQTSAEKLQKIAEIIDSEKGPAEMVAAIRGVISS